MSQRYSISSFQELVDKLAQTPAGPTGRLSRSQFLDGASLMRDMINSCNISLLTAAPICGYLSLTSLLSVSAAGRGAAPSGAAPAFFAERRLP